MPMHRKLMNGGRQFVLLESHERLPERHESVSFGDRWHVERRLRECAEDFQSLQTLRELGRAYLVSQTHAPISTDSLVRQVAMLISHGRLRLALVPEEKLAGILPPSRKEEAPAPQAPVQAPLWFSLKVIDDMTDEPISGIQLRLKLPDSPEEQLSTNSSGEIYISRVPPGRASVASVLDEATLAETLSVVNSGTLAPRPSREARRRHETVSGRFLAQVLKHRVRGGETLRSIAEAYSLTEDQLTHFNWGTTDPKEVQDCLYVEVGCSQKDDAGQFVLSSHDRPGLICIPRPINLEGLALEKQHLVRVTKVPTPPVFLFSA